MIAELRIRIGDTWERALSELLAWSREVTTLLNAPPPRVRSVVIDTGDLPMTVELPRGGRPMGVQLVRAVEQGSADERVLSGGSVEWDAVPSGVRLHSLAALAATTRYDAVISVTE